MLDIRERKRWWDAGAAACTVLAWRRCTSVKHLTLCTDVVRWAVTREAYAVHWIGNIKTCSARHAGRIGAVDSRFTQRSGKSNRAIATELNNINTDLVRKTASGREIVFIKIIKYTFNVRISYRLQKLFHLKPLRISTQLPPFRHWVLFKQSSLLTSQRWPVNPRLHSRLMIYLTTVESIDQRSLILLFTIF